MSLTGETAVQSGDSFSTDIEPADIRRIPTGVADLDAIVEGGFPQGSVVLLMGEEGAGMREYVYTSAAKLTIVREEPRIRSFYLGHASEQSVLPEKICYVTFARSREVVLREFAASLNEEYYRAFRRATVFKDFSAPFFRHTVVPASWTEPPHTPMGAPQENFAKDLVNTVKGLQRAAKRWNGIVYLLLTRDILEPRVERMIVDSVDGCLVFEWSRYLRSSKRQRYMYVEKFASVLPHLPMEKIARFPIMITSRQGLVVVYMERIG